ncbi:MAG: hypothetical protein GEV04_00805 [Actinophytocola sp.]|nr:hypothetical protein [Actinophytocola sp.]
MGTALADHAFSAQLLAAHRDDPAWRGDHVDGCVHPWLDGYTCAYCELPVRTDGDHRHPGYGVVEHTDGPGDSLRVLHRFCNRMRKCHTTPDGSASDDVEHYGIALRRAWLGWATDQFVKGAKERHFGVKHYERLGLHPAKLRSPALFRKYWMVRKMRCAAHAIHYYTR